MINPVIVDTGVLVGFLSKRDNYHKWCVEQTSSLKAPLYTCESVITEACYLLRKSSTGSRDILNMVSSGLLVIEFALAEESESLELLMKKYADVPMDLADACIVRMSELLADSVVLTLDKDFRVYRKNRNKVIPLICP